MHSKSLNKTDLLFNLSNLLKLNEIENFEEESQIMIAYAGSREKFIDVKFNKINENILDSIVKERLKGKPLSKIIRQKGFWKNIFITDENTLDPRADSEIIIENILNDLSSSKIKDHFFIDICCGSGCLGISILDEFNKSSCDFIDISEKAISVCKKNISKIKVESQSSTYISDLFSKYPIERLLRANFLICNPPYIPTNNYYNLDNQTLYDPKIALDGGEDGIIYYVKILNYLKKVKFTGDIFFEIDPIIINNLEKFLLEKSLKIVYKKTDYRNLDRVIKITFP